MKIYFSQITLLLVIGIASLSRLSAQENVPANIPVASAIEPQQSEQVASTSSPESADPKLLRNYVELGGSYLPLSNNFGHWSGGYGRGSIDQGKNVWFAEINGQHEFEDAGVYFAVGDTYTINDDWYAALTVGSSAGGFFWPRYRADAFINKKWLGHKQWITTVGYGFYASKDVHRDDSFYVGTTYYFSKPWIVEEGIRFNISNPGTVTSPSAFVAVTQGRNKQHYLTVRVGLGEEAYQLVGPTATINDFQSQTVTVTWRKWMGRNWGLNLIGDFYHSPFYVKGGSMMGFFKEF
jgi:YaiO family outer membrane protein